MNIFGRSFFMPESPEEFNDEPFIKREMSKFSLEEYAMQMGISQNPDENKDEFYGRIQSAMNKDQVDFASNYGINTENTKNDNIEIPQRIIDEAYRLYGALNGINDDLEAREYFNKQYETSFNVTAARRFIEEFYNKK